MTYSEVSSTLEPLFTTLALNENINRQLRLHQTARADTPVAVVTCNRMAKIEKFDFR